MALKSPPEMIMRNAIKLVTSRTTVATTIAPRAVSTMTSRNASTYRIAMVTDITKPMEIQHLNKLTEIPDNYARVAVHHASINFADILLSQGKYQVKPPLPFGIGSEFAGKVLELGKGVSQINVGDIVQGVSIMMRAFAEEIILPVSALTQLSDGASTEEAAALISVYGTAWMALKRHARIQEGDIVLVTAAAGGVGLATVDLAANLFKARVIAACGSDEKCAVAKEKGAFAAVNYRTEAMNERVKDLTQGHGADIIMDSVGGDVFKSCLRSVAFEGRIIVIGFASGDIPKIPANILLVKSCSAIGIWWGDYSVRHPKAFKESIDAVIEAYKKGQIKPHVSKVVPLEDINEAFQYILDRKSTGKVIIDCRPR